MRYLTAPNYPSATVVDFEDSISKQMPRPVLPAVYSCLGCTYDVRLNGNLLVDYKSYLTTTNVSVDQFKQYLQYWQNTAPVRNFQYVFNGQKLTLAQAKQKFVNLLQTNPVGYFDINPAFFARFAINPGSVPLIQVSRGNIATFLSNINTNHTLFDFVIIKP